MRTANSRLAWTIWYDPSTKTNNKNKTNKQANKLKPKTGVVGDGECLPP